MVYRVRPSVDEYDKLIEFVCLEGLDWEMEKKLHEEMKRSGFCLKGITRGLIRVVKEMEKEVVEAENIAAVVLTLVALKQTMHLVSRMSLW